MVQDSETSSGGSKVAPDPRIDRDLATLVKFVDLYCRHKHAAAERAPAQVKGFDLAALSRRPVVLCPECTKLLRHALVKRAHCPLQPKPACKHCPVHCYHPTYRAQIRQVMKDSGRRMVLSGRLDLLYHLLF